MQDFEKLGVFYLGKQYDMEAGTIRDDLLLYDSKDLTTHAVCVGMTGSGKTGLCIDLLEEAAIDHLHDGLLDLVRLELAEITCYLDHPQWQASRL